MSRNRQVAGSYTKRRKKQILIDREREVKREVTVKVEQPNLGCQQEVMQDGKKGKGRGIGDFFVETEVTGGRVLLIQR